MILFNYLELRLPDPRKFINIANVMACSDAIEKRWRRRERKLASLERRAREQRRLDWESNVRRRKRRLELQRRERG